VNRISRIIHRGLVADGRLIRLRVRMQDRPGSLARLAGAVAGEGGNVVEIVHQRAFADISVGDVDLVMQLETRGREHGQAIIRALEAQGLAVEEEL
jgi:threonine dehydratase